MRPTDLAVRRLCAVFCPMLRLRQEGFGVAALAQGALLLLLALGFSSHSFLSTDSAGHLSRTPLLTSTICPVAKCASIYFAKRAAKNVLLTAGIEEKIVPCFDMGIDGCGLKTSRRSRRRI